MIPASVLASLLASPLASLLAAAALTAAAAAHQPSGPWRPPDPPDPGAAREVAGIFTYRIDERCRPTRIRKLQGPEHLRWSEVERALDLYSEHTVFRMTDGGRRQLIERRVVLTGELVQHGELHCLLSPMGELVDAWIARLDPGSPRQRVPHREPVPIRGGALSDLGTFSVVFDSACDPAPRRR